MIKKPIISVIIPTRNHHDYIRECLDSVFEQKCDGFKVEIIVGIDGADQTKTKKIVKFYKGLKVIKSRTPIGSCNMRNLCISHAKGKFIALMDSDDIMLSERLINQYNAMTEDIDIVYSNCIVREDETGEEHILMSYENENQYVPGGTFFMRTQCAIEEPFDETWKGAFDYEYYLRTRNKFNYFYLNKKVIIYRRHTSSHLSGTIEAIKQHQQLNKIYGLKE